MNREQIFDKDNNTEPEPKADDLDISMIEEGTVGKNKYKKVRFSESTETSPKLNKTNGNSTTNFKKEHDESMRPHPLGIKPFGNYYIDKKLPTFVDRRKLGLGSLVSLSDQLLFQILDYLPVLDIVNLAKVSKIFYSLSYYEELWREKYLSDFKDDLKFRTSWRISYLLQTHNIDGLEVSELNKYPIKVDFIYSDHMFQPWLYTSLKFDSYIGKDTIERRNNLSLQEFIDEYETPNIPVILTDVVDGWEAYKEWDCDRLLANYGDTKFRAEAVEVTLQEYIQYSNQQTDESPLYLFDKKFPSTCPELVEQYTVPKYFNSDLFKHLEDVRPDFRWLIVGPERSGSTFHKDPNATSAWNAVIQGKKKWILFPPSIQPPGIFTNRDQSEVTAPVSIMEWHLNYYKETQKILKESRKLKKELRPVEGICNQGEIIFVPSGWWHLVVNLEFSIALTQNFVSEINLPLVLRFLKEKPDQVSGFNCNQGSLYERFKHTYGELNQQPFNDCETNLEKKEGWKKLVKESTAGFSFSFGFDDAEEEANTE